MLCNNNIGKATSVISKNIGTGTVIYAPFLTKLSKSARKKNLDKSIKQKSWRVCIMEDSVIMKPLQEQFQIYINPFVRNQLIECQGLF